MTSFGALSIEMFSGVLIGGNRSPESNKELGL